MSGKILRAYCVGLIVLMLIAMVYSLALERYISAVILSGVLFFTGITLIMELILEARR